MSKKSALASSVTAPKLPAAPVAAPTAPAPVAVLVVAPTKPRGESFPDAHLIVVVSTANPKRPGTKAAAKWKLYDGARTVRDLVVAFAGAGLPKRKAMSALRWDSAHGFVKVEAPTA